MHEVEGAKPRVLTMAGSTKAASNYVQPYTRSPRRHQRLQTLLPNPQADSEADQHSGEWQL